MVEVKGSAAVDIIVMVDGDDEVKGSAAVENIVMVDVDWSLID